jgi:hypothetical protein
MIGLTGWLDTTELKCINENQYILPYRYFFKILNIFFCNARKNYD